VVSLLSHFVVISSPPTIFVAQLTRYLTELSVLYGHLTLVSSTPNFSSPGITELMDTCLEVMVNTVQSAESQAQKISMIAALFPSHRDLDVTTTFTERILDTIAGGISQVLKKMDDKEFACRVFVWLLEEMQAKRDPLSEIIGMQVFLDLSTHFPPHVLFKRADEILRLIVPMLKGSDEEFIELGLQLLLSVTTCMTISLLPFSPFCHFLCFVVDDVSHETASVLRDLLKRGTLTALQNSSKSRDIRQQASEVIKTIEVAIQRAPDTPGKASALGGPLVQSLTPTTTSSMPDTAVTEEDPVTNPLELFKEAKQLLYQEKDAPERARGVRLLETLLKSASSAGGVLVTPQAEVASFVMTGLRDEESFVYLPAISAATRLLQLAPSLFAQFVSTYDKGAPGMTLEVRLRVGEVLTRYIRQSPGKLGEADGRLVLDCVANNLTTDKTRAALVSGSDAHLFTSSVISLLWVLCQSSPTVIRTPSRTEALVRGLVVLLQGGAGSAPLRRTCVMVLSSLLTLLGQEGVEALGEQLRDISTVLENIEKSTEEEDDLTKMHAGVLLSQLDTAVKKILGTS